MLPAVFLTVTFICLNSIDGSIHRNLKHFDIIHASQFEHRIVKRGIKASSHPYNTIKEVKFDALGRNFRLILSPKKGLLHSKFKAYEVDGDGREKTVHVDHDNFYDGRVFGEKKSGASVHLDAGMMTASIQLPDETYHVEPMWRHLPDSDNKSMIVYRASDVKLSWQNTKPSDFAPKSCGYVKEVDDEIHEGNGTESRDKRQIDQYEFTPTKTRCPLLLVADYRFFQEMGASNTKTTINYLISLIDRVHNIYNDTIWIDRPDQTDGFKGMGFVIKKIVVHSEHTRVRGGDMHYNMMKDKWDVRNLLEVFSREFTHKDFCLAHLFTDLKFEGGILGLAYVGSPRRNSVGGICTPEYFKNGYTLYLNSGLSSSRNHYGQRVITREADLVTAHEFGHNWGSEHDPDIPECSPSASHGGSYLMYTYSVSGYDVNNKRFSPCSLRSIRKVLLAKSGRCFSEPEESFCGNLRVEGDEECDAGLLGTEDNDKCCDKNCKLRWRLQKSILPNIDGEYPVERVKANCSDKNSPCCLNCGFLQAGVKCRDAQQATCEREAVCSGLTADCPPSPHMPNGTPCLERGECHEGKCIPFCETQGLQSCMCDQSENACKRCCRTRVNDTCSPIDPLDILPDGTPCFQGFCNKGQCEKTVQDVVERFWDIIEDININKVLLFLRDNIVGTIMLVSALIWIPASCLISYFDRRKRREEEKCAEWQNSSQLVHPSDNRKILYAKVPRAMKSGDQ